MSDQSCQDDSASWSSPAWLVDGGCIPVLLGIAGMFWGISFVCEEYGVPSLTAFCKRNKLSDALTGSIFIGTGLSLPVFFVAVTGLFASKSAIGVGAVVGGNLFNHLFTIASSIYVCPDKRMKLDAAVFTREMLFYFLSCILVLWAVAKGSLHDAFRHSLESKQWNSCLTIEWKYSLILVVAYVAYCVIDANFFLIDNMMKRYCHGFSNNNVRYESAGLSSRNLISSPSSPSNEITSPSTDCCTTFPDEELIVDPELAAGSGEQTQSKSASSPKADDTSSAELALSMAKEQIIELKAKSMLDSAFNQGDNYLHILDSPMNANVFMLGFFYMTYPLRFLIYWTTPDVRRPGREHQALLSLFMVVAWLAVLSYVLTTCLTVIGNWWHISGAVMGITIGAWASNFPAHWSSIVVSRHGYGDVSCCNCFGSNTFNNFIGLGLPWLLYNIAYRGKPYSSLQDDGVAISVFFMMGTIVLHYIVVLAAGWELQEWMIVPMMIVYAGEVAALCYLYTAVF